jgi:hypothetical protein
MEDGAVLALRSQSGGTRVVTVMFSLFKTAVRCTVLTSPPLQRACSAAAPLPPTKATTTATATAMTAATATAASQQRQRQRRRRLRQQRRQKPPPAAKARDRTEGAASDDCAGVYVLRNVESGVCYVGKSDNVARRIGAHHRGSRTATLRREPMRTRGSAADLESYTKDIRVIFMSYVWHIQCICLVYTTQIHVIFQVYAMYISCI